MMKVPLKVEEASAQGAAWEELQPAEVNLSSAGHPSRLHRD